MDRRTLAAYIAAGVGLAHKNGDEPVIIHAAPVVEKKPNKLCDRCKNQCSINHKQRKWCFNHKYDEKCCRFKLAR